MALTAYLAGPDCFLPHAIEHARKKVAICAKYGITGLAPVDPEKDANADFSKLPSDLLWRKIFSGNMALMMASDIVIANLTPFRGPSADVGTAVEVGYFLGQGKPVFAYTNDASSYATRTAVARIHFNEDRDMTVEAFGLPDNLMLPGACLETSGEPIVTPKTDSVLPFDSLTVFARCVETAARVMRTVPEQAIA